MPYKKGEVYLPHPPGKGYPDKTAHGSKKPDPTRGAPPATAGAAKGYKGAQKGTRGTKGPMGNLKTQGGRGNPGKHGKKGY